MSLQAGATLGHYEVLELAFSAYGEDELRVGVERLARGIIGRYRESI